MSQVAEIRAQSQVSKHGVIAWNPKQCGKATQAACNKWNRDEGSKALQAKREAKNGHLKGAMAIWDQCSSCTMCELSMQITALNMPPCAKEQKGILFVFVRGCHQRGQQRASSGGHDC
eukprot:4880440-Amphidinium_carterae.1